VKVSREGSQSDYVVVHLVAQESGKALIGPQVVDHMAWQASVNGVGAPSGVAVGFIEPMRTAIRPRTRRRVAQLRRRAGAAKIMLLPIIGRLGTRLNARAIALRTARFARGRAVVFHCRGESAVEWAVAVAAHVKSAGIVADIRGAWPEEALFARGYDGPNAADARAQSEYRLNLTRLSAALAHSGAVLSVSPGMIDWLVSVGADPSRVQYVPCCVSSVTASDSGREEARRCLGLIDRLVFAYSGTAVGYQHIEDGVAAFFRAAASVCEHAHLLCLTEEPDRMRHVLAAAGIADHRVTVKRVTQEEVPRYLAAADAGLLLRRPSRLNRFSQPTKFAEYLASGVPVVVSHGTGVLPEFVEHSGAGMAVRCFGLDEAAMQEEARAVCTALERSGAEMRQAAAATCEREFLWTRYVPTVRAAYLRAVHAKRS
jgi:glycosyltransferase involved in cell wall biosynthesis